MIESRRASPSKANLLAQAMSQGRNSSRPGEAAISMDELGRIKASIQQVQDTRMTETDLVLAISRLRPDERTSDLVHSKVSDFFHRKGETSLNKWQIN